MWKLDFSLCSIVFLWLIITDLVPRVMKKIRLTGPSNDEPGDAPELALRAPERNGLENLLSVRPAVWSRTERTFLRTVLQSLQRALKGSIGYGETAPTGYAMETVPEE